LHDVLASSNLAPGAEDLLRRMTDPSLPEGERIDAKKKIRDFTIEEWAVICKAFDEWPFAPEVSNPAARSLV
jgi:transcription factor 1